jgi:ribose/xylose/arabinose/galactoside ABC-type transport system permease subunit
MLSIQIIKLLFVVISVGLVLTIYEYSLFYFILAPQIKKELDKSLNNSESFNIINLSKITNPLNSISDSNVNNSAISTISNNPITNYISDVMNISQSNANLLLDLEYAYKLRENKLIKSLNNYTIFGAIIMLIILVSILVILRYILIKNNTDISSVEITTIIITLSIIFIFQGLFYIFGQKFNFPNNPSVLKKVYGSRNVPNISAELKLAVYDKIRE